MSLGLVHASAHARSSQCPQSSQSSDSLPVPSRSSVGRPISLAAAAVRFDVAAERVFEPRWLWFATLLWLLPVGFTLLLPVLATVPVAFQADAANASVTTITFAQAARPGEMHSVSLYVSAAPAAGLFGALYTSPIAFALFLPSLNRRWFQTAALVVLWACVLLVAAAPHTLMHDAHFYATGFVVTSIAGVAATVVWTHVGVTRGVAVATLCVVGLLATVRVVAEYRNVGYMFYATEVLLASLFLALIPLSQLSHISARPAH